MAKETIFKMKREPTVWENIFANDTSDKSLISKIYEKLIWLNVGGLRPQGPLAYTDENKSTKTWSAWGGKVADLSKEKGQEPFPQWAFIGFNLYRNTGKAHQSLSGSKDQITENKELWGLILSQGQLAKGL